MCRQYNDLGSLARDVEERNLNSINFPEFASSKSAFPADVARPTTDLNGHSTPNVEDQAEILQARKSELFAIAAYERECLAFAASRLEEQAEKETMERLRVFVDVTDLYGQIYVARDMTPKIQKHMNGR